MRYYILDLFDNQHNEYNLRNSDFIIPRFNIELRKRFVKILWTFPPGKLSVEERSIETLPKFKKQLETATHGVPICVEINSLFSLVYVVVVFIPDHSFVPFYFSQFFYKFSFIFAEIN